MYRKTTPTQVIAAVNSSLHGDQAGSRSQMAAVSPCSSCKKFSTADSAAGSSVCPRRNWISIAKNFAQTGDGTDPQKHLTSSGTDDPDTIVNPVYDAEDRTIVIWVASLDNNPGVLDADFDTTNINCDTLPVVPFESQSQLFSMGVYHELDQLLTNNMKSYQKTAAGDLIQIGGFARKVHFVNNFSQVVPDLDQLVSGT